jgi:O-antigen/teichoic acid export membrane protein
MTVQARKPALSNGVWNALAQTVSAVVGVVGSLLVVRGLTTEEYGEVSYYLWLAGVLGAVGCWAMPGALTKLTSELRGAEREREATSLALTVVVAVLGVNALLTLAVLVWALAAPDESRPYLVIVAVALIPQGLATVMRSALWGVERYQPVALMTAVSSVVQLALIAIAFVVDPSAPLFLVALLSMHLVQGIGMAVALVGVRAPRWPAGTGVLPNGDTLRSFTHFAVPATVVLLFDTIVWQRSGVFFLERSSTLAQVGYYGLAYTCFGLFLALGWALVNGYYPAISRAYGARDWVQVEAQFQQALMVAALFATPICLGGIVTAETLLTVLYGDKMRPAAPVTEILFLGLLPGVISGVFGLAISAVGGIWLHVRIGILISVVNIGLNLWLVPSYGAIGSAVATTAAQILAAGILIVVASRTYRIKLPFANLAGVVAIGIVTTGLVPLAVQQQLGGLPGLIVAVGLAGLLYVPTAWWLVNRMVAVRVSA